MKSLLLIGSSSFHALGALLPMVLLALSFVLVVGLCSHWTKGFAKQRAFVSSTMTAFVHASVGFAHALKPGTIALANIGEGTHAGSKSYTVDEVVGTRYLLGKKGSDANHIAIAGAADEPIGVITDEAASIGDRVAVEFLGISERTQLGIASETIDDDEDVYVAAGGQLQDEPAAIGTYYKVGRSRKGNTIGLPVEYIPCAPQKLVVIAVLTAVDGAATAAADITALKPVVEAIGDDLRRIGAALATGAKLKVLSA